MSLIEKEYFTLAEVVDALAMPWTDVLYLAENGRMRLSVLVFQLPMEINAPPPMVDTTEDLKPYEPVSYVTGLVDLGDRDAHLILKNGSAPVERFKTRTADDCSIAEEARPQIFEKHDLLLRRCERTHLEAMINTNKAAKRVECFTHSPSYRDVAINGVKITLGARQAHVVRLLHEAALTGNPWRNGKELLKSAGSQSNRMHDLFKSKKTEWPLLIDSDRRGLYRLAISETLSRPSKRARQ